MKGIAILRGEMAYLLIPTNLNTQCILIVEERGFEPRTPACKASVLANYTIPPNIVVRVGIEPTSPEGDRFTVCGAHHLPNRTILLIYE